MTCSLKPGCSVLQATSSAVEAADGLRSLRIHAEEAKSVLSTIPEQCTTESHLITTEYVKALYSIFNCSYNEVINGAANIALETAAYAAMDYETITKLLVQFTSCSTKLNPLTVIECDFNEIINAYGQIKDMITSTENFISDMKSLITPLKFEIENCLKISSVEYSRFLNKLIHKARTCEINL